MQIVRYSESSTTSDIIFLVFASVGKCVSMRSEFMANVKNFRQIVLLILIRTSFATAAQYNDGYHNKDVPQLRFPAVTIDEYVQAARSLHVFHRKGANQLRFDHAARGMEYLTARDPRDGLAHGPHMLNPRSRNLLEDKASLGTPGDEMWIDGIMEKTEAESLHPKAAENAKQSLIANTKAVISNTSTDVTVGGISLAQQDGYKGGKACAEGCTLRGNCNLEDGRCECQIGFAGPTCNIPLMPACQASQNDLPFWGLFLPKNCECYEQACRFFNCTPGQQKDCQLSLYQTALGRARCYLFDGKPKEEQWSSFPEEGAAGVSWFMYSNDGARKPVAVAEGRKLVNMWGHDKCKAQPLSACPSSCSRRGVCMTECNPKDNRPAWCECHKSWAGPGCEESLVKFCPNACSGRGNCSRGFCHCKPPWFGIDCSRSKANPERPLSIPSRYRLVIYMYELPHSVSSPAVELDDNLPDDISIYSAYNQFLDAFLKDWAVRTEDPWEANLFYIPAFTYSYSSNTGNPAPHLKSVIDYINKTYPFLSRNDGKDHFMWFTGDRGSCYAPSSASSLIKLVHFGLHLSERRQAQPVLDPKPGDPLHGCHHPVRDVVTAPYNDVGYKDAQEVYKQIFQDKGASNRSNLFFFAGGVRANNPLYSGGVRQAVHQLLTELNKTTWLEHSDVVFIDGHTDQYLKLYMNTQFCLAPYGGGFGIRLSIAMVHGCIPVVIQDHVFQPFEDIIPYEEMSVRIAKRDIPDLIPILRAISIEEQRQMRLKMAEHYRAFIWEPVHGGMAYNYTLAALHRRLHSMWSDLYRKS
ncbi:hypothetical protein CEUSTIGMA_g8294.t1 [Chlamydomonas eustigma]|uniref:EGF-like domain-containing protein n=1 Tax=Chlamydomonas eustigma TaxID=1157962 RepID=A0A250XD85_9CHLO|nr:hypothetical protein CEUSTIGMA_g8294.t1 [Chlamydomonas eustigma]|eukprot:GAX80859.1 hypothetical protein CEUSTIGMA_g8294.t1 [Chlamydomonas eustigma]